MLLVHLSFLSFNHSFYPPPPPPPLLNWRCRLLTCAKWRHASRLTFCRILRSSPSCRPSAGNRDDNLAPSSFATELRKHETPQSPMTFTWINQNSTRIVVSCCHVVAIRPLNMFDCLHVSLSVSFGGGKKERKRWRSKGVSTIKVASGSNGWRFGAVRVSPIPWHSRSSRRARVGTNPVRQSRRS